MGGSLNSIHTLHDHRREQQGIKAKQIGNESLDLSLFKKIVE
jgi:hypothetical protein